jgi:hypothetical protein
LKALQIGLIGAGFSPSLHLAGLRRVNGVPVRVSAAAAGTLGRAEAFARAHDIPLVYTGYAVSWLIPMSTPSASAYPTPSRTGHRRCGPRG